MAPLFETIKAASLEKTAAQLHSVISILIPVPVSCLSSQAIQTPVSALLYTGSQTT